MKNVCHSRPSDATPGGEGNPFREDSSAFFTEWMPFPRASRSPGMTFIVKLGGKQQERIWRPGEIDAAADCGICVLGRNPYPFQDRGINAMRPIYLFILIWALGACAQAKAECAAIPAEVEQYLRSQPGWAVVDMKDLVKDDQALWERNHSGLCPGIAAVDLDGTGTNAYAVALLNSANGQETERAVVLRRQAGRVTQEPLVSPTNVRFANVASPLVVWRAGPGTYRDRT